MNAQANSTLSTADMSNSPFLNPGLRTTPNGLAIVQLSRDQFQPVYLHDAAGGEVDGYAEGAVLNTRFGSFPHSTMIGVPWGSQVRASVVDTGSRGRKRKRGDKQGKQDKTPADSVLESVAENAATPTSDAPTPTASSAAAAPPPPQAASGFVHILRPTPEVWTLSLPHRTQVVYTGDYSYILHRLRARPGASIIEAGAGSGSFSHASARAVYGRQFSAAPPQPTDAKKNGHVYSFEFHNERYRTMQAELEGHGLSGDGENDLVTLTNRDVYANGFLLDDGTSPEADAVFLDLPAPWRALQHLTRSATADGKKSALNPSKAVYLCSFSPCIEQVMRTVSMMRRLGWVDIDMVEVANKKILVYREKPELVSGKACTGEAGKTVPAPRDVGEAVARLKTIETRTREYNQKYWQQKDAEARGDDDAADKKEEDVDMDEDATPPPPPVPSFMEGRVTSRVEPEVKTHTSYLVFAVLPRAWSEADEAAAAARWPVGNEQSTIGAVRRDIRKEQKRQEMRQKAKGKKNRAKE